MNTNVLMHAFIYDNSVPLDMLWPSNGAENLVWDGLNDFVSKYVHELKYGSDGDEMCSVFDMYTILAFSNSGENAKS